MSVKKSELRVVRLSTGELLMGELEIDPQNRETVKLRNVMGLMELPPKSAGEVGQLAMMPYLPFTTAQDEVELVFANIAVIATPQKSIADKHRQAFSKIMLPDSNTIGSLIGDPNKAIGDMLKGNK